MNSVLILGAGAWGSALAVQAERAGSRVTLWARDPSRAHRPATALLPDGGYDAVLLAVPTQHLRDVLHRFRPAAPAVICAKGIEAGTGLLPLEILADVHGSLPAAVLTGPNFAGEIARGLPAAAVVAAADPAIRQAVIPLLASAAFRLYGNDDPVGAQLGGAAKNVIAIAAGVVAGAGLGENARAALITRGLAELTRCVVRLGGRAETVAGLSGLGDLLLTCTGAASRNFRCGVALGEGRSLPDALAASTGVVEGVATAPALLARAAGTELPICAAVDALLAGRLDVTGAAAALLNRPMRDE